MTRRKMLDTLNKQRRRLFKKGALSSEISDYFGFPAGKRFSSLNDRQLAELYNQQKKKPNVGVYNSYILPTNYKKRFDAYFGEDTIQKPAKGYKRALESPFLTRDNSLSDVKKRRLLYESRARDTYALRISELGDKTLANKILKLTPAEFDEFLEVGDSYVDYSTIFANTDLEKMLGLDDENIVEANNEILKDINRILKQYKEAKRL